MGKVWVKLHLDVRPDEEEVKAMTVTGQGIQGMMDILYSDIMRRGDTMIIRVTDDDRSYVFYQRAEDGEVEPYALASHVFSLKREAGRKALICAIGNCTDRLDPNIRDLIYGDPEATRYLLDKTATEVAETNPKDTYVRSVAKLQQKSDAEVIAAIKSVTFFVKKIKLTDEEDALSEENNTEEAGTLEENPNN